MPRWRVSQQLLQQLTSQVILRMTLQGEVGGCLSLLGLEVDWSLKTTAGGSRAKSTKACAGTLTPEHVALWHQPL
jgi:hypothetical protein